MESPILIYKNKLIKNFSQCFFSVETWISVLVTFIFINGAFGQTSTFTSSGSWVCPAGVTTIQVEAWGAGGAGGNGGSSNKQAGGGGGGGGYSKNTSVTVVPGTTYTITIGAGGITNVTMYANGATGGTTTATFGGVTVSAAGGVGGYSYGNGGAGGAGGVGETYSGGTGGTGESVGGSGGGGGEGSGTTSNGGNGSGATGGSGTDGGNGANGNGPGNSSGGNAATLRGGGGSGSVNNASAAGAGYKGEMLLTFTCPASDTPYAGPDQTLATCVSTATLNATAAVNGTGTWTVISGSANITSPNSPTSGLTALTIGASATLRWTISNGECTGSVTDDVIITTVSNGSFTWRGDTSTDWFDATNWCGTVPLSTSNVIIPSGTTFAPTIGGTSAAVCLDLTINSGATLTVSSSNSSAFLIYGNLLNNGTITHTGSSSATSAATAYWIQMTGASKTIGGAGDFSTVGLFNYTSGSSTTMINNITLSKFYHYNTGTDPIFNLDTYTLIVTTMFYQLGQFNLNSGTIEYTGTATKTATTWTSTTATFAKGTGTVYLNNSGSWDSYPSLAYYNLKIKTNSGQEHHGPGTETIENNFELVAGTSGGKLHHHSTTLTVSGNVTVGAGTELNLAFGASSLNLTVTGNVEVNGTITCYSTGTLTTSGNLTINSGGTITSSTSSVISVGGNWVNNGTFTKSTGRVTFTGAANKTITGTTATSFYNITVNKSTDTTYCIEATEAMSMTGHLTLTNGVMKLTHASSSAQFTSDPSIPTTSGLWINGGSFITGNHTTTNAGLIRVSSGAATFGTTSGNFFDINGASAILNLTGGTLSYAGFVVVRNSGNLKVSGSSVLNVCTVGLSSANATCDLQASSNITITGGTIIFQNKNASTGGDFKIATGAGTKSITGGTIQIGNASTPTSSIFLIDSPISIYNLTVNSTNDPTARLKTNALTVSNNVTISGGVLDANTNSLDLSVGGNWINNSSTTSNSKIGFDSGSKKVTFNGGAAQTISGSAVTTFYDLTIANTLGDVTLAVDASTNNTLTMSTGKLVVQGYTITIGTAAANGSISGGSSTSYIVAYDNGTIGSVKHLIFANSTFSYPIGDATNYVPLTFTLSASTLASAYLTVYTKAIKIPNLNPSITGYINRYWSVTPSGITSPTYNISYTYVAGDVIGGTETGLLPIKKSGTTWYRPLTSTFTTGTAEGTGSYDGGKLLSWTGLSTFSLFGGAISTAVALPIKLVSFTGKKTGVNNELKWTTASEQNNDFFTIEKTIDGIAFEIVGIENGAGNSNEYLNYSLTDYNVRKAINYYRLKQTDFDGKYDFSEIIAIDNSIEDETSKEIVLKTNILGQEVNEYYRGIVVIVYSDGSSIKVIQ